MDSVKERVARGAALLDEKKPDWWTCIDVGKLEMADPCACVLGQNYSLYSDGLAALWGDSRWCPDEYPPVSHGFDVVESDDNDEFDALEEEWVVCIKDRWANG